MLQTSRYAAPDTLEPPRHWDTDAACKNHPRPDLWFAEPSESGGWADVEEAKRHCYRCPAMTPCLTGALERGEPFGVWGGLLPDERRAMVRHKGGDVADATAAAA
ncbi:WhiB family transcriptional regulator [Streptomyces sp. ME03-5709C]|nr:WhiB family transcriptional regulator [Streptomyces sp. ME03-5709C]